MKKIRIGNDIRLAVDLNTQLDLPAGSNNVRQVSAYLINTTKLAEYENKAKARSKFIGRFPREPFSHDYNTTPWCLCGCGKPTWNAYPTNAGYVYSGFGVEPYKGLKEISKLAKSIQYKAACYNTQYPNQILVDFPADQQLYTGIYTLILVVKLYVPGYTDNTKTVSTDMPNVFELVKSVKDTEEVPEEESGSTGLLDDVIDTGVTIVPGDNDDPTPSGQDTPTLPDALLNDIYVNSASVSDGVLSLGRTDAQTITVDLGGAVGWFDDLN